MLKNRGKFNFKTSLNEFLDYLIRKGCSIRIYRLNGHRRGNFKDFILNDTTEGRNNMLRKIETEKLKKWLRSMIF